MRIDQKVLRLFISGVFLPLLIPAIASAQGVRPGLTVTSPEAKSGSVLMVKEAPLRLRGTATGVAGIDKVSWENMGLGFGDRAVLEPDGSLMSLTINWSTGPIGLRPGTNYLRVTALDRSNQNTESYLTVVYQPENPLPPESDVIKTSYYNGHEVTYHEKNGLAIFQGDIILGTAAEMDRARALGPIASARRAANGGPGGARQRPQGASIAFANSSTGLWQPSAGVAQVPFTLSANTQSVPSAVTNINNAVTQFNGTFGGVIQWVARGVQADYVTFDLDPNDHSGGCEATVGRVGGQQLATGSIDCNVPVLLHEMGHAIGLWHEQSRSDRDTFVSVVTSQIDKLQLSNFDKLTNNEADIGLYDYASLMHYGNRLFGKFGTTVTLQSTPVPGITLSNQTGFSSGDIDTVKRLYGAAPSNVTIDTNPTGGQIIVDSATFTAPHTFVWAHNSIHTLNVGADPQTIGGNTYRFGVWNDGSGTTASHQITVTPGDGSQFSPATSPAATVYVANLQFLHQFAATTFGSGTLSAPNPLPTISFALRNYYYDGQQITVTAVPNVGYSFYSWGGFSGVLSAAANPNTFIVIGDLSNFQGQFTTNPVQIIASAATNGYIPASGQFGSLLANVDGGNFETPVSFSNWGAGTQHTIAVTATPYSPVTGNISYAFANWSDSGAQSHSIFAPAAATSNTVTANFLPSYRALVTATPTCGGSVTPNPSTNQADGTLLNYTATANSGMTFVGWSGDITGNTNPNPVTLHDELLATANFNVTGTTAPIRITSVSPASAVTNGNAADLVLTGTGFTAATQLFWNLSSTVNPPTFTSSTQMTLHLDAGDLASVGYGRITAQNVSTGGCATSVEFTYNIKAAATAPSLSVTKNHTGNFIQGQQNATYTVQVSNIAGAATTSGTVTVTENIPTGLTFVSMSGLNWDCTVGHTCTRSDGLIAGHSYESITVTVNVAVDAPSQVTNSVTVTGGGSTLATANDLTTVSSSAPDLTITKTHIGDFTQGQNVAQYTITVTNSGATATSGTVTMSDTVPTDLTPTGAIGGGWGCTVGPTVTCTRSDALAAFVSYPAIVLTVAVSKTAAALISNTATVSGGSEVNTGNDSATDNTIVVQLADVTITKTHTGNFALGQAGAQYTLRVKNEGNGVSSGTVTVVDTLPAKLTATAIGGPGWTCSTPPTLQCTRSSVLMAGWNYPDITVTVTVAPDAPASVINAASVSGGGEVITSNDSAIDHTTIVNVPILTITKTHTGNFTQGQQNATYTVQVSNAAATTTSGTVTVTENLPTGLSFVSMSGTNWNCTVGQTCTRTDGLTAGHSYDSITVTVNVDANAAAQVTNSVTVTGGGSAPATANDPTTVTTSTGITYKVGDVYPFTADTAPNFGDGLMNILDLVQELFAVNNIPGFRPAACSDRFDAMDLYPIDTVSTRGGDGLLDIRDLVRELFRVNNLDLDRPVRTSRGGVCASSANTMSAAGRAAPATSDSLQLRTARSQGTLLLGDPEKFGADEERIPLYLKAESGLARIALTLALGDQRSALRFAASPETPPSLAPSGPMGVVALAWLEGMSVRAGDRILLGYVIGPAGVAPNLSFYGLSAMSLDDDGDVRLDAAGVAGSNR